MRSAPASGQSTVWEARGARSRDKPPAAAGRGPPAPQRGGVYTASETASPASPSTSPATFSAVSVSGTGEYSVIRCSEASTG
jgi:hypothetical protein